MVTAFAPATVSNVACGFDVLGFALEAPGDLVSAEAMADIGVEIASIEGDAGRLPLAPGANTAGRAVQLLLLRLQARRGVRLRIYKGIPLASGVGGSGASAVAALVATNELLGRPASLSLLLECAVAAEAAGCGSAHPDNVAPALYGGFVLTRASTPPEAVQLPVPPGLSCAVLHPHSEISTRAARELLGETVPLRAAVQQWGNVGALVAALFTGDLPLLGRTLEDHIAEPVRAHLVPRFPAIKDTACQHGALGCSLSGSGPSIFALCPTLEDAEQVGHAMHQAYADVGAADLWISPVAQHGARIVTA